MALELAAGRFDPGRMLVSLLLVPNTQYSLYLVTSWTLCFEILFYACFALVLAAPRRLAPVAIGTYALAMAGREFFGGPVLGFLGNPLILEFLAGCIIVVLPKSRLTAGLSLTGMLIGYAAILITGYEAGAHQSVMEGDAIWVRLVMWGIPSFF